ncbi:hypothetical protein BH11ARM2_BH11ARM2_10100 [soil metagenome]
MRTTLRRHCHAAFTLIELLTVIAISAILLTLILIPLFQSFNLTRQAQALADAQDKGRILTSQVATEIDDAVAVREGGRTIAFVNGVSQAISGNALIIKVPLVTTGTGPNGILGNGGQVLATPVQVEEVLPFAKLDLVRPAAGEDSIIAPGVYRDPVSGKVDPTLTAPKGQVKLPVAPGQTIVRYFVALHDPFSLYNNPYDGLLVARNGNRDNLYVLYRGEVTPRRWADVRLPNGTITKLFINDTRYFDYEGDAVGTEVATGLQVGLVAKLDDPRFMLDDGTPTKATRIQNWLSRSVVQTEISRYDMVQTLYDLSSRRVLNDAGVPRIVPLVQFRPGHVGSDPAEGMTAVRPGEESGDGSASAPDVFTTKLGLLSNTTVRTWPVGWRSGNTTANEYLVGRFAAKNGLMNAAPGFSIYAYDPDVSSDDYLSGVETFDVTTYNDALSRNLAYPASLAISAANARSGWLSDPKIRSLFTPYNVDTAKGRITASFPISEFGNPNVNPPVPSNLPNVATSADENVYTPRTEPNPNRNFYTVGDINGRFNVLYNLAENDSTNANGVANLDLSRIQRHIDLRVTPMADGSQGPLDPSLGFKASIVPGSEIVLAPSQAPGTLGTTVRYTRVNSDPGINQYAINYKNRPEPGVRNTNGVLNVNYGLLGVTAPALTGFDPTTYNAQNFVSAVLQPQYKAGYMQFNSNPNQPLPAGRVSVYYRVQFTAARAGGDTLLPGAKQDTFAVDYDSRELMNVLLTIRNYPQSSLPNPQNVTLKATGHVRNYLR